MLWYDSFLKISDCLPGLCPLCDSPHFQKGSLCSHCDRLLRLEVAIDSPRNRDVDGIPVLSLFTWKRDGTLGIVPEILYAIKGGGTEALVQELTGLFLLKHSMPLNQSVTLIPAPAKKFGACDHALGILRGFAGALPHSREFSPLIRGEGRQKSRGLDARKRSTTSFTKARIRRYRRFRDSAPVVFVDDVVTSGATLRAAWKALGRPSNFSCWCLADRCLTTDDG